MTLVLPLSVTVSSLLIADEEAGVLMRFFLSRDVHSSVDEIALFQRALLKFPFDLRRELASKEQKRALATANLVCFLFVTRLNDTGDACLTTAGCGRVPLGALLREPQTISLIMPCIDYRTGALPKGVVQLAFRSAPQLASEPLTAFLTRNELVPTRTLPPPHAFRNYIRKCEHSCMPSTFQDLTNIDMFIDPTVVGDLPAKVFVEVPKVYVDESFFRASAEYSARRLGLTREQILALNEKTNENDAQLVTFWLANVLSIYSQYCHYISDEVYVPFSKDGRTVVFDKQEIDLFEYPPIHYGSGDCEDLSSMFLILSRALRNLKPTDPLVLKLQNVHRAFIVALLLDGVTTGQINDSSKAGEETTSAHMSGCLLERSYVERWFGHKLLHPENDAHILSKAPKRTMLEGTGPLNPDNRKPEDPIAVHNREKLYKAVKGLSDLVRQMYSCRDGKFYKKVKLIATPEISEIFSLYYLTPNAQATTAGVLFSSMTDETLAKEIQLVPQAPLSDEDRKKLKCYKRDLHPVFPLLGPAPERGEFEQIRQSRMQMAMLAKKFSAVMRPKQPDEHAFCLLANYSNFDKSGQFVQLLGTAFATFNAHTGGSFSWDEEQVTGEGVGGFYLLFYSKNKWQ
jgi:hypothetical protein